jgi:hypothetical protein
MANGGILSVLDLFKQQNVEPCIILRRMSGLVGENERGIMDGSIQPPPLADKEQRILDALKISYRDHYVDHLNFARGVTRDESFIWQTLYYLDPTSTMLPQNLIELLIVMCVFLFVVPFLVWVVTDTLKT